MSGTAAEKPPSTEVHATVDEASAALASGELVATDELSQFLLKTRSEIFAVFRGLVDHVSQITMFFNEGRDLILTGLISYDDNGIYLDLGASPEMNRRALAARKLFCVTQLERVKVQFLLDSVTQGTVRGTPAFRAPLPDGVLRLQRREYYRMATPIARPLKCAIALALPDGGRRAIDAHIGDISGGGIGIISIPLDVPLERGQSLDCRIELPEVGVVNGNVVVRSLFETVSRTGAKSHRAGCEFVRLPGPMLTLIQRYIIKIERERKARESGMI